jgi:hypothetical protein
VATFSFLMTLLVRTQGATGTIPEYYLTPHLDASLFFLRQKKEEAPPQLKVAAAP